MKLSQLRILIAVADRRNFGEAALELGISQSAVSHAIATLEAELGIVLVARGRHGANLTPVGQRVTAYAQQMMQLEAAIVKEANLAKGLESGQVRVASFRSVATHILPRAIAQLRQRFPGITVALTEHDDYPEVEQALRTGVADVGFLLLPVSTEFETWKLLDDEYVALFPAEFQPITETLSWEELAAYPLILPPESNSCSARVQAHCWQYGKPLNAVYVVREDSTTVNMVMQGLGATVIPRLAAEPIPATVKVYSLPEPLFRTIGVGVLAEALLAPAVYAFLETLKQFESAIDVLNSMLNP